MRKKDLVKEKICKAAMDCFAKYGLDKTTLDDIAKKVGLNKASLYYYYKNKEDIFIEAAMKEGQDFILHLQENVQQKKNVESQVLYYMEARFNYYKDVLNMNRVSVETLNKILPRFFELYDAMMKQEITFLASVIKGGVQRKEIATANAEKLAGLLISVSDALKHSEEQLAILNMGHGLDYAKGLEDMKFLIVLIFKGIKPKS